LIFSIFWWFYDPLEQERLYGQLIDEMDANLDTHNPDELAAPDKFDVFVNNKVFIKHANSIARIETYIKDRLQKYVAEKDYVLPQPRIQLQIISSATVPKRKAEIRCWFSSGDAEAEEEKAEKYSLKVLEGEGSGLAWELKPGNTYSLGRRKNADICLPYKNISKNHATLYFMSADTISIVDESSVNGTFINKEENPIKGSRNLKFGDKIKLCKVDPITMILSKE